jgi:hypothetical protein
MYIHIFYKDGIWKAETMEDVFSSKDLDKLVDFLITKLKLEYSKSVPIL